MKKLVYIIVTLVYFSLLNYNKAQTIDSLKTDSIPINKCQSAIPSNLANIGNWLFENNMRLSDCWHNNNQGYDHFNNLKFFNKKFDTKVFSNVFQINFLVMYPRDHHCCEYIIIKEWCFPTNTKSLEAIKILQQIQQAGIFFKMPVFWMFIQANSNIYFIESREFTLQNKYMQTVKNAIIQSSESVFPSIVEFPK